MTATSRHDRPTGSYGRSRMPSADGRGAEEAGTCVPSAPRRYGAIRGHRCSARPAEGNHRVRYSAALCVWSRRGSRRPRRAWLSRQASSCLRVSPESDAGSLSLVVPPSDKKYIIVVRPTSSIVKGAIPSRRSRHLRPSPSPARSRSRFSPSSTPMPMSPPSSDSTASQTRST